MKRLGGMILGAFFLFFLTTGLVADDDPPGRVARLQYMSGSVSIQPRGTEDWVEGSLNRPLTSSDNIWADKDSRAELSAGTGFLRISSETSLTLTNISDNAVQVQLHQGALSLTVRRLSSGEIYEVDTPNLAFAVQKSGEYRFDVGPSGDATVVTVWKGEGEATGDGPAVRVKSHQRAQFSGGTSLTNEISEASAPDGFDDWSRVRDRRVENSASARYVAPGTIGSEDLDENGTWRNVAPYGPVWVPTGVAPGWAPYRYGHWVWIDPWGWTWVDDAAWGFAPFHYGRWVYTGGYWGWAPGPYYARPFYAPALVAWFGGPRWGVGLGFAGAGFGWCPLGFGEPFFPWFRTSRGFFRNVNINNTRIVNITNVTNNFFNNRRGPSPIVRFANLRAPGGMTAVSQRTIVHSLPVGRNTVRVSERDFAGSPLHGNLSLTPTRDSRLGVHAGRPSAAPPQRIATRPVVSQRTSPSGPSRMGGTEVASVDRAARPLSRTPEHGSAGSSSTSGRFVPRPPQKADHPTEAAANAPNVQRPSTSRDAQGRAAQPAMRSVPRPPVTNRSAPEGRDGSPSTASRRGNAPSSGEGERQHSASPAIRAVPRPPAGSDSRRPPNVEQHAAPRSQDGSPHSHAMNTVPRPTGRVMPARYDSGREYGSRSTAPSYSPRSGGGAYGTSSRSYGGSPRYSAPSSGRSYSPAPSYRGSAPAYHGSAPSSRGSAPSSRGSAPSSHGSAPHPSSGGHHGHRA